MYESKVVGVSKDNADGTSRQKIILNEVEENERLFLEPEPSNPHDAGAIKVLSKFRNQIGYLNRELAESVKPAIENGTEVIATVKWVNGEKMLGVGLRIELVN